MKGTIMRCKDENCNIGHNNTLPHEKTSNMTKLKAFVDDKLYIGEIKISVFHSIENIVGKDSSAGY